MGVGELRDRPEGAAGARRSGTGAAEPRVAVVRRGPVPGGGPAGQEVPPVAERLAGSGHQGAAARRVPQCDVEDRAGPAVVVVAGPDADDDGERDEDEQGEGGGATPGGAHHQPSRSPRTGGSATTRRATHAPARTAKTTKPPVTPATAAGDAVVPRSA